ncbi:MAG: HAMP domain-containing sensor histidine kinase [Chthoniobacterales bacterium]
MTETATLVSLADFLEERRGEIIREWQKRVKQDAKIPTADELPRVELLDHLPLILDTLIDQLRKSTGAHEDQVKYAETHGELRWRQNYRLDELLGEISILRKVLGEMLLGFFHTNPTSQKQQQQFLNVIHRCLDSVLSHSVEGFVKQQQDEIQIANQSLKELTLQTQKLNTELLERDDRRLRMLRTIIHEMANHLNVLVLIVSVLKKSGDREAVDNCVNSLSQNISAMTGLMKELLEFSVLVSEGEIAKLEGFDLKAFFEEIAGFTRRLAEDKGLTFHGHFDSTIGTVISDHEKLRRICVNLTTNAVKYTAKGEIRLSFTSDGKDKWCIEVQDTGCGIDPKDQEKVFDEFYRASTTKGSQPGVGLGLSITTRLVKMLGGTIELSSTPGTGTTFRVRLPKKQSA